MTTLETIMKELQRQSIERCNYFSQHWNIEAEAYSATDYVVDGIWDIAALAAAVDARFQHLNQEWPATVGTPQ